MRRHANLPNVQVQRDQMIWAYVVGLPSTLSLVGVLSHGALYCPEDLGF